MRVSRLARTGVVAAALVLVAACGGTVGGGGGGGGGGGEAGSTEPLKIGVITSLTGAYVQLGEDQKGSCSEYKLKDPDPAVLKVFQEQQREEAGGVAGGLVDRKVCEVEQIVKQPGENCKSDADPKWCYVENAGNAKPAGRCSQAIVFSAGTQAFPGARFSLQCIRQFSAGAAAGDNANTSH